MMFGWERQFVVGSSLDRDLVMLVEGKHRVDVWVYGSKIWFDGGFCFQHLGWRPKVGKRVYKARWIELLK